MTTIFDVWKFVNSVSNTYLNGYVTPEEFSTWIDQSQNTLWSNYVGKRQIGNELALPALQPFYKRVNVVSDTTGLALYPNLWAETQGIYKEIAGVTVTVTEVLHNELQEALSSVLYPVSANPRYLIQQTGVQIYPKQTTSVDWHYLSKPTTPVLGYTVGTNNIIYNPATSVQLEFETQYWNEIIALCLPYVGVNLSDQEITALSQTFTLNADNGNAGN